MSHRGSLRRLNRLQNLAQARSFFSHPTPDALTIRLETSATDSFQNLLSLIDFIEYTGHLPSHITIISHAFKRERFLELHCKTIRWPLDRLSYVGIDPPMEDEGKRAQIEKGEAKARQDWVEDWWGWGPVLGEKRYKRGWDWTDNVFNMWDSPEWATLATIWGKEGKSGMRDSFPKKFPWEEMGEGEKGEAVDPRRPHLLP